jgi:selenocysteine-specific elongation factor
MAAPAPQVNITLGTAGHIDHGKTALVKSLTGCETDRLREEKERGMSIELGFAPCTVAGAEVGIVDVPGHEHFIKTMVAGASGMDGVILVVAADDGVMPQTREHLDILTLLGMTHGLVALTKIDRVDAELLEMVQADLRAFLQGTFLADAPILPVSNVTGDGFGGFIEALSDMVRAIKPKAVDGVFRLPVERAFSVKGYGTVVSGIPVSGQANVGDEVVLLPAGLAGRIKAIQVYGRDSETVLAGQCAALNMRHWDHAAIERDNVIAAPGYFQAEEWCVCRLRLLPQERLVLKTGTQVKFHTGTSEVLATLHLLRDGNLVAGNEDFVQVRLNHPVVVGPGDRFIVRSLTPVQTVGGGVILEPVSRRLKRNRPGLVESLTQQAGAVGDVPAYVEHCIRTAEGLAASQSEICQRAKVQPERFQPILEVLRSRNSIVDLGGGLYIHKATADEAIGRVVELITRFHSQSPKSPGMSSEELGETCGWGKAVLDGVLNLAVKAGRIEERARRFAVTGHRETFSEQESRLLEAVEKAFADQLFHPPDVDQVPAQVGLSAEEVKRAIRLLMEHDRLVRVSEEVIFHKKAIDRAREVLIEYFRTQNRLDSVQFKYLIDTTRKYAIPLLDHMDRIGVTSRVGNTRFPRGSKHAGQGT